MALSLVKGFHEIPIINVKRKKKGFLLSFFRKMIKIY